jgi:hypothetical protein
MLLSSRSVPTLEGRPVDSLGSAVGEVVVEREKRGELVSGGVSVAEAEAEAEARQSAEARP